MNEKTKFISVPEAAKILKISRIAVFKSVKKGKIPAIRIGRNWAIPANFKIPPHSHPFRKARPSASGGHAAVSPFPKKFQSKKYHERTKKAILGNKERKMKHSGQKKSFPAKDSRLISGRQFINPVDNTLNSMGWD